MWVIFPKTNEVSGTNITYIKMNKDCEIHDGNYLETEIIVIFHSLFIILSLFVHMYLRCFLTIVHEILVRWLIKEIFCIEIIMLGLNKY